MYFKPIFAIAASAALGIAGVVQNQFSVKDASATVASVAPVAATAPVAVATAVDAEAAVPDNVTVNVQRAIDRLGAQVTRKSHSEALHYAFRAYYKYRDANPSAVRKPYLYFVDFGLGSETARGYVFDMDNLTVVSGPFHVAHGSGSGGSTPTRFLNVSGSNATSLGLYLAQETYAFNGRSGGRPYKSVGLRLKGVSGKHNDKARARGIVAHGAPYVTSSRAGRSQGCPAMPQALASDLLPKLANGGMVFHFSPNDANWMRSDPWAAPGA
jgi:hypothetical protein